MYDLGLYVGLFEILRDLIGLLGLYGLKYDGLIASVIADCYCTCALIDWTVLLHISKTRRQGFKLNGRLRWFQQFI